MTRKNRTLQRLAVIAVLGVAECAGLAAVQAQDFPFLRSQRAPRNDGGFFGGLFGGPSRRQDDREYQQPQYQTQQAPADNSKAPPPPRKSDQPVTTSVVVLGDGMADWLAYGLEDAFGDAPEVGIVRKSKAHSGLIKYDPKSDLDWWRYARDLLAPEKPSYVIMMLGVSDRQNLRQSDIAKEADKKDADKKDADKKPDAAAPANGATPAATPDQTAQNKDPEDSEQSIAAPEPVSRRGGAGSLEFRGEQWEKIYTRRIDDTIAALKSKGVPVFWVGLPSIRGGRSTSDASYLNDLYRARAEKAGAVYIDVWDGFVDETGKYNNFGPDYEGQMRRLRSSDGVYFTKFGARKLAHYVERELRRYMSNRGPVAMPSGPMGPVPADGKPTARPLAGPVVPLTITATGTDELVGGSGVAAVRADAQAVGVLVKGDAVAAPSGRADDFWWPRGSPPPVIAPPVAATPPAVTPPVAATAAVAAPAVAQPQPALVNPEPMAKPAPVAEPKPEVKPEAKPRAAQPAPRPAQQRPEFRPAQQRPRTVDNAPRPPQPVQRRNDGPFSNGGPFGLFR